MPKETAHQYLAAVAAESIHGSGSFPEISKILRAAPNLFMMGSVAPDSAFNYTKGPAAEFFRRYMNYSHGKGRENADSAGLFGFFLRFAEAGLPLVPALSFGLGALCHLSADMVIHPAVFYFTGTGGESSKEATLRHYRFESELDRLLRWIFPELRKTHLAPCFRRMEMEPQDLARALEAMHIPPDQAGRIPAGEFVSMYRQHTVHEKYYGKTLYYLLARLRNALSGGGEPELPALFYRDRRGGATAEKKDNFLNRRIRYKNPRSGAGFEKSFSELRQDFIGLFEDYLRPLEQALKQQASPSWGPLLPVFRSWISRSPDTGQPIGNTAGEKEEMGYFEIMDFEEAWGRI